MVDISGGTRRDAAASAPAAPVPDVATVRAWIVELSRVDPAAPEADRVARLRVLEELKAAASGAQARESAALDASIRAGRAAEGRSVPQQRRGIAAQVGLARRESPHRGRARLRVAKALVGEMPHTLSALCCGALSEERAELLVELTAHLSLEHRLEVDRRICADVARLEGLGTRALADAVRRLAYRLDPEHAARRVRHATSERRVTLRPAPDAMAWLTALVPAQQGLAAFTALTKAADGARTAGDVRPRGQVLADTLVERVTGQRTAEDVSTEVQLVITDRALLGSGHEPARLIGYGTVPAGYVRDWLHPVSDRGADDGKVWLRRLFTHPGNGDLVGMDSHRRLFPTGLRRLLVTRDQSCRTPYCDAPIRHTDHVRPQAAGGPTSAANGQGLCEACSYAKEASGWRSRAAPPRPGRRHTVETRTPTGHTYHSTAPPLPGTPEEADTDAAGTTSRLEHRLRKLLAAA